MAKFKKALVQVGALNFVSKILWLDSDNYFLIIFSYNIFLVSRSESHVYTQEPITWTSISHSNLWSQSFPVYIYF